jgi:hypothetical protein
MMVELLGIGVLVTRAAVGPDPGGPTGVVKLETAMVLHIMGSNVSVTVRGTVVPPRPWLDTVVFLGPGPTEGTDRGGAVEGGTTEGSVDGEDDGAMLIMGKVGWMIGIVGRGLRG